MKHSHYTIALLLTISITLSIQSIRNDNMHSKSIEIDLIATQTQLIDIKGEITLLANKVARIGVQDVERLTRENQELEWENASLKDQIREFGWLKE